MSKSEQHRRTSPEQDRNDAAPVELGDAPEFRARSFKPERDSGFTVSCVGPKLPPLNAEQSQEVESLAQRLLRQMTQLEQTVRGVVGDASSLDIAHAAFARAQLSVFCGHGTSMVIGRLHAASPSTAKAGVA